MEFKFFPIKTPNPNKPIIYMPYVSVKFINGYKSKSTRALIDTGAEDILLNAQIAKDLEIDLKKCMLDATTGIENKPIPIYRAKIEMEFTDIPNSRIPINMAFIKSASVGVLLGKTDFLDNFKVIFEKYKDIFHIELKS